MARLNQHSTGRQPLPLEKLDNATMRARLNASLDKHGLAHDAKAAVHSLGRGRRAFKPVEEEPEETPDDFFP